MTETDFFRVFLKVLRIDWDVTYRVYGDVLDSRRPRNRAVRAAAGAGRDFGLSKCTSRAGGPTLEQQIKQ